MRCHLDWRPRDTNTEADDLATGRFVAFDASRRVLVEWSDLRLPYIQVLMRHSETFSKRKTLDVKPLGSEERFQVGLNQLASLGIILRDSALDECSTFTCIQMNLCVVSDKLSRGIHPTFGKKSAVCFFTLSCRWCDSMCLSFVCFSFDSLAYSALAHRVPLLNPTLVIPR